MAILKDRSIFCFKCEGYVDFEALNDLGQITYTRLVDIFEHPTAKFSIQPEARRTLSPGAPKRILPNPYAILCSEGDIYNEGESFRENKEMRSTVVPQKTHFNENDLFIEKHGRMTTTGKMLRSNTEMPTAEKIKELANKAIGTDHADIAEIGINSDIDDVSMQHELLLNTPSKNTLSHSKEYPNTTVKKPSEKNTSKITNSIFYETDPRVKPTIHQGLAKAKGKVTPISTKIDKSTKNIGSRTAQERSGRTSGVLSPKSREFDLESGLSEHISEAMGKSRKNLHIDPQLEVSLNNQARNYYLQSPKSVNEDLGHSISAKSLQDRKIITGKSKQNKNIDYVKKNKQGAYYNAQKGPMPKNIHSPSKTVPISPTSNQSKLNKGILDFQDEVKKLSGKLEYDKDISSDKFLQKENEDSKMFEGAIMIDIDPEKIKIMSEITPKQGKTPKKENVVLKIIELMKNGENKKKIEYVCEKGLGKKWEDLKEEEKMRIYEQIKEMPDFKLNSDNKIIENENLNKKSPKQSEIRTKICEQEYDDLTEKEKRNEIPSISNENIIKIEELCTKELGKNIENCTEEEKIKINEKLKELPEFKGINNPIVIYLKEKQDVLRKIITKSKNLEIYLDKITEENKEIANKIDTTCEQESGKKWNDLTNEEKAKISEKLVKLPELNDVNNQNAHKLITDIENMISNPENSADNKQFAEKIDLSCEKEFGKKWNDLISEEKSEIAKKVKDDSIISNENAEKMNEIATKEFGRKCEDLTEEEKLKINEKLKELPDFKGLNNPIEIYLEEKQHKSPNKNKSIIEYPAQIKEENKEIGDKIIEEKSEKKLNDLTKEEKNEISSPLESDNPKQVINIEKLLAESHKNEEFKPLTEKIYSVCEQEYGKKYEDLTKEEKVSVNDKINEMPEFSNENKNKIDEICAHQLGKNSDNLTEEQKEKINNELKKLPEFKGFSNPIGFYLALNKTYVESKKSSIITKQLINYPDKITEENKADKICEQECGKKWAEITKEEKLSANSELNKPIKKDNQKPTINIEKLVCDIQKSDEFKPLTEKINKMCKLEYGKKYADLTNDEKIKVNDKINEMPEFSSENQQKIDEICTKEFGKNAKYLTEEQKAKINNELKKLPEFKGFSNPIGFYLALNRSQTEEKNTKAKLKPIITYPSKITEENKEIANKIDTICEQECGKKWNDLTNEEKAQINEKLLNLPEFIELKSEFDKKSVYEIDNAMINPDNSSKSKQLAEKIDSVCEQEFGKKWNDLTNDEKLEINNKITTLPEFISKINQLAVDLGENEKTSQEIINNKPILSDLSEIKPKALQKESKFDFLSEKEFGKKWEDLNEYEKSKINEKIAELPEFSSVQNLEDSNLERNRELTEDNKICVEKINRICEVEYNKKWEDLNIEEKVKVHEKIKEIPDFKFENLPSKYKLEKSHIPKSDKNISPRTKENAFINEEIIIDNKELAGKINTICEQDKKLNDLTSEENIHNKLNEIPELQQIDNPSIIKLKYKENEEYNDNLEKSRNSYYEEIKQKGLELAEKIESLCEKEFNKKYEDLNEEEKLKIEAKVNNTIDLAQPSGFDKIKSKSTNNSPKQNTVQILCANETVEENINNKIEKMCDQEYGKKWDDLTNNEKQHIQGKLKEIPEFSQIENPSELQLKCKENEEHNDNENKLIEKSGNSSYDLIKEKSLDKAQKIDSLCEKEFNKKYKDLNEEEKSKIYDKISNLPDSSQSSESYQIKNQSPNNSPKQNLAKFLYPDKITEENKETAVKIDKICEQECNKKWNDLTQEEKAQMNEKLSKSPEFNIKKPGSLLLLNTEGDYIYPAEITVENKQIVEKIDSVCEQEFGKKWLDLTEEQKAFANEKIKEKSDLYNSINDHDSKIESPTKQNLNEMPHFTKNSEIKNNYDLITNNNNENIQKIDTICEKEFGAKWENLTEDQKENINKKLKSDPEFSEFFTKANQNLIMQNENLDHKSVQNEKSPLNASPREFYPKIITTENLPIAEKIDSLCEKEYGKMYHKLSEEQKITIFAKFNEMPEFKEILTQNDKKSSSPKSNSPKSKKDISPIKYYPQNITPENKHIADKIDAICEQEYGTKLENLTETEKAHIDEKLKENSEFTKLISNLNSDLQKPEPNQDFINKNEESLKSDQNPYYPTEITDKNKYLANKIDSICQKEYNKNYNDLTEPEKNQINLKLNFLPEFSTKNSVSAPLISNSQPIQTEFSPTQRSKFSNQADPIDDILTINRTQLPITHEEASVKETVEIKRKRMPWLKELDCDFVCEFDIVTLQKIEEENNKSKIEKSASNPMLLDLLQPKQNELKQSVANDEILSQSAPVKDNEKPIQAIIESKHENDDEKPIVEIIDEENKSDSQSEIKEKSHIIIENPVKIEEIKSEYQLEENKNKNVDQNTAHIEIPSSTHEYFVEKSDNNNFISEIINPLNSQPSESPSNILAENNIPIDKEEIEVSLPTKLTPLKPPTELHIDTASTRNVVQAIDIASISIEGFKSISSNGPVSSKYTVREISHPYTLTLDSNPGNNKSSDNKDLSKLIQISEYGNGNEIYSLPVESIEICRKNTSEEGKNSNIIFETEESKYGTPTKKDARNKASNKNFDEEAALEAELREVQERLENKKSGSSRKGSSIKPSMRKSKPTEFNENPYSNDSNLDPLDSPQILSFSKKLPPRVPSIPPGTIQTVAFHKFNAMTRPEDSEPASISFESQTKSPVFKPILSNLFSAPELDEDEKNCSSPRLGYGGKKAATTINSPKEERKQKSMYGPKTAAKQKDMHTVSRSNLGMSSYSRISQVEVRKASSTQKHVRGMMNHGDTSHLNVILQSLYSIPLLVKSYTDPANAKWTNTKYNKQLKAFFQDYTKSYGPYDPLPFILHTLIDNCPDYNVFNPHDPYSTMERILYSLLESQKSDESQKAGETALGRLFTSIIQQRKICTKCGSEEWGIQETESFTIPSFIPPSEQNEDQKSQPPKYTKTTINDKEFYIPQNLKIENPHDITELFCAGLHQIQVESSSCKNCQIITQKVMEHYIRHPASVLFVKVNGTRDFKTKIKIEISEILGLENTLMIETGMCDSDLHSIFSTMKSNETGLEFCKYKLCAVIPEKGSDFHSVYVKHSEKWYYIKDSHIKQVSSKEVKDETPYLLFYQRVNSNTQ